MKAYPHGCSHGTFWARVEDKNGKIVKVKTFPVTYSGYGEQYDTIKAQRLRDLWVEDFNEKQLTSDQKVA